MVVWSVGWTFADSGVHVLSRSVVDVYIDEWVYQLLDVIEQTGARRIVIDSLPDVMVAAADPTRFREWMFSLTQRLERAGISMMMIVEVPELFQLRRISEQGLSHLADNVVLLQYVQEGPELVRALTVLKTRAMHHHPVGHRYDITEKGFVLGDVLTLTRSVTLRAFPAEQQLVARHLEASAFPEGHRSVFERAPRDVHHPPPSSPPTACATS